VRNVNFTLDLKIMLETGLLMVKSLFYRDRPIPLDSPVYKQEEPLVKVKKIA
jgi:hypothetical protein